MYALIMHDRLLPMYQHVVQAQKAADKLADPEKTDWDAITAALNAVERQHGASSSSSDGAGERSMVAHTGEQTQWRGASRG